MIRAEATSEQLIVAYMTQFGEAREWDGTIRLKWILNTTTTTQLDEDELVLMATREKNKTL